MKPSEYSASASAIEIVPGMPYSIEAEQAVLGSALLDDGCLTTVLERLREEHFYYPLHRKIYTEIKDAFETSKKPDFIIVLNALSGETDMANEELKEYLLKICGIVPTLSNVTAYIKIVLDKFYMRTLYSASKDTIDSISSGSEEADFVLERAEQRIYDIRQGRDYKGLVPVKSILGDVFDEIDERAKLKKNIRGISTGYGDLDRALSGLNKSDMVVLAARPGVGKSAFAINIGQNVAASGEGAVCVFSLEMSKEQIVQRMLAAESNLALSSILTGQLNGDEWTSFAAAAGVLAKMPFYIDDTAGITISEIKARLRRIPNLALVIIDYLQLMQSGRRIENRVVEVSEMTRATKIMAKELNVPVILISQLSRGTEQRGAKNRRPMLSDLRESGSIEQDADVVMFLYREDYYDKLAESGNQAECIIEKNRHGATKTIMLYYHGASTKFVSAAFEGPPPEQ